MRRPRREAAERARRRDGVRQLRDRDGQRRLRRRRASTATGSSRRSRRPVTGRGLPGARRGTASATRPATTASALPAGCRLRGCSPSRSLLIAMIPAAAVRRLAVAAARARRAGRRCGAAGRSTAPPWPAPAPRRDAMDTLISLGVAGRVRLVGRRSVAERRPRTIYLEVAAGRRRVSVLAGPLRSRRGPSAAPARRCGAARAGRQGRASVADADGAERARPDRRPARRRPLRRPPGREDRHRRRRRGGPSAIDASLLTGESRAGRGRARRRRSPAPPSTPAAGSSCGRRGSAPTPRSRRSPGS